MYKTIKSTGSWTKVIKAYQKSGLSKSKYCSQNNIKVSQFFYWCNKLYPDLKSIEHSARAKKNDFLPVLSAVKPSLAIELSNGLKVKFESIPEPIWLSKLLSSIGQINDQY
jgi:hypothetical protein